MLNPLNRSQQDYIVAMTAFAATPGLDRGEKAIVENLLAAARKSIEDFDSMRHVASTGTFHAKLWSAIGKARAAGIGANW